MGNPCHWALGVALVVGGCAMSHERDAPARGAYHGPVCSGGEIRRCNECDASCCLHFCQSGAWSVCSYVANACTDASPPPRMAGSEGDAGR